MLNRQEDDAEKSDSLLFIMIITSQPLETCENSLCIFGNKDLNLASNQRFS